MPMSLKTTGTDKAQGRLKLLRAAVANDGTRKAVSAAAKVIAAAETELAPMLDEVTADSTAKIPGSLKGSISFSVKKDRDGFFTALIGPRHRAGRAAHLVEFGHRLVKAGKLKLGRSGQLEGGNVIGHVPAHPFLRPAFESSWKKALDAYAESMKKLVRDVLQ